MLFRSTHLLIQVRAVGLQQALPQRPAITITVMAAAVDGDLAQACSEAWLLEACSHLRTLSSMEELLRADMHSRQWALAVSSPGSSAGSSCLLSSAELDTSCSDSSREEESGEDFDLRGERKR